MYYLISPFQHELTHGYDDEGVQFGPTGELSDCTWESCGWMDKNSTLGFIQMAQCVVSQVGNFIHNSISYFMN